ncbi:MAG: FHA domain-containing protein [Gemmataceae bacterium]|nr:FHA domain-containing protein [Gemmataceae bacterium]
MGTPIPITGDLFLIGSDKFCQLRNSHLGSKHCALVTRDKKVFLRDFNSGQPTTLNGEVLPNGAEWPLHAGDKFAVGNLEFMIQYREKPLSGRDLEEWAASCLDVEANRNLLDEEDVFHAPTNASEAAQSIIERLNAQKGFIKGRLRIGLENGVTTVRFNDTKIVDEGEIAMIKKELCDNLHKANLRVLLDLKNVRRLSSLGVTMIGEFNRWLKNMGSTMALCRVRSEIQGMLGLLHVDGIKVFPDKRSAIMSSW